MMQGTFPTLISCKPIKSEFKIYQQIDISSEEFTIGRGLNNSLVIPFLALSRSHCKFIKNDKNWILEDHSTFGIKLNGVKLGKGRRKEICDGDVIELDPVNEFVYKFVDNDSELMPSSAKRIKLEPEDTSMQILNDVKIKFEESQNCEMRHIEDKIESTKQIKTTNMLLKEQLQLDMKRKIEKLESDYAAQIENLKGEKNEVEKQKALLIEKRDEQLATLKQDMEGKISELMEQIRKHNEIESELIVENNSLKEKLLKEREEFLAELNRESSLKQDMLNKLESKMKEQEEIRLKEKQEFESLLQKETEQLRLAKEKELNELIEQRKKRESELMEELTNIKKNLEEQEKQKLEVQQQFNNQMEELKKLTDEDKVKMEQLMHVRLHEAQQNAQKSIESLKTRVTEREIELSALAAERIQKQAEQSSEVICSLQDQLEKVRSQLESVERENMKLLQNTTSDVNKEGTSKSTLAEFGEILENELQCSICAEMFVSATTLNCSHTFCKYCITMWKKKKKECPICRAVITSECSSLVLNSFIETMVQNLSEEMKQKRRDMLQSREDEESRMNTRTTTNTSTRRNTRTPRGSTYHRTPRGSTYHRTQRGSMHHTTQTGSMHHTTQTGLVPPATQMGPVHPTTQTGPVHPTTQTGPVHPTTQTGPVHPTTQTISLPTRNTRNSRNTNISATTIGLMPGLGVSAAQVPMVDLTRLGMPPVHMPSPMILQELVPGEVIIVGEDIEVGYQVSPAPTTAATGDASVAARAATGRQAVHYAAGHNIHNANQFF